MRGAPHSKHPPGRYVVAQDTDWRVYTLGFGESSSTLSRGSLRGRIKLFLGIYWQMTNFSPKVKVPQVLPEKISPLFVGHKINLITCKINFTFLKTHGCPSAIPSPARVSEDGTRVSPACDWLDVEGDGDVERSLRPIFV